MSKLIMKLKSIISWYSSLSEFKRGIAIFTLALCVYSVVSICDRLLSHNVVDSKCPEIENRSPMNTPLFSADKYDFKKVIEINNRNCYEYYLIKYHDNEFSRKVKAILSYIDSETVIYPLILANLEKEQLNNYFDHQLILVEGSGYYLIKDGSPLLTQLPSEFVARRDFPGRNLSDQETRDGIIQKIKTRKKDVKKIPENKSMGGSMQRSIIIDNGTNKHVVVDINLLGSGESSSARIDPYSYLIFELNTELNPDIVIITVKSGDLLVEQKSFKISNQLKNVNELYTGYYIYNIEKANSYRVVSQTYIKR